MRFTSLALFAGVSLAAISAWSNTTDVSVGLHSFDGDDSTSRYDSSHHSTSHYTDHRKPPHRRPPPHKGPHRRPSPHRKPPHHRTKKGFTTYCPHSTVVTITTCKKHVCGPTLITVSEPTSITLTEDCLVEETDAPEEHVTGPAPPVTKVVEYTVTDYVTYCPKPTVLTYTKYVKHKRIPVAYTVAAPSTITITGTCILASTITSKPTASVNAGKHVAYGTVTKTVEETYTEYTTYCPTPTVFTVTKLVNKQRVVYDVTVTEATTLTVHGTCVVASTITEEVTLTAVRAPIVKETTVTEYTTYCPQPTLLTVIKLVEEQREASVITVTKATTITVPGTLVVATTITEDYKATKAAASLYAFIETAYETTVTEYTTYVSTPTALTVTQLVNNVRAVAVITVTEATTISVPGTVVYVTTAIEETANPAATVVNAAAVTTTAYTVTDFTTYFPSATVYTVTQVVNEEQTVSVITVTEATTVSVPGTVVYASVAAVAFAQTESTVTEFTTYIPEATLYTVTQIVNEQRAVNVITVTEATTLAVPGTIVISAAVTADAAAFATVAAVAAVNAVTESVVASTVTEFSTYLPYATAFTFTQLVDNKETVSVISVTEATTLFVEGTLILASTVTAPPAADVFETATAGPTDTVILESTALPNSVAAQAVAAAFQGPEVSASPYSVSPAVTTIENGAAKRVAGIVGVIGVIALLY